MTEEEQISILTDVLVDYTMQEEREQREGETMNRTRTFFKTAARILSALEPVSASIVAERFFTWAGGTDEEREEDLETDETTWDWPVDMMGGKPELAVFRALCAAYRAAETEGYT